MACDYYQLLQITSAATFDEVHKAYRSLALQYHPDRNPKPDAAATMVLLNEAYAVLSEPSRRREYDATRLKTEPFDVAGPILRAAYDTLLKQGWTVAEANASSVILEQGQRVVRVIFTARLDNVLMKKIGRQFAGNPTVCSTVSQVSPAPAVTVMWPRSNRQPLRLSRQTCTPLVRVWPLVE